MKRIAILSIAAIAAVSCLNDMYEGVDRPGSKLVVTADIDQVKTKVSGLTWDRGDRIGVSSDAGQDNILYTTAQGDGRFTTEEKVYILGAGEKTYTAYYPYDENAGASSPVITFTEPADYMWTTATASRENPEANFLFAHKMSKLSINVRNELADEGAGAAVQISGIAVGGTFNTLTGEVTAAGTSGKLSKETAIGSKVSFILPVQAVTEGIQVIITYKGKAYSGKISIPQLAAGNEYNFTISIPETEVLTDLTVSSDSITDWTPNEGGDVTVEEQEVPNTLEVGDFLLKDGTVIDMNSTKFEALKDRIAGVVYYVGNPQPSVLYEYSEASDILRTSHPSAVNGLAIALDNANNGIPARFSNMKYDFGAWYKDEANAVEAANYIPKNLNLTSPGDQMLGYNNTALIRKVSQTLDSETNTTGAADVLAIIAAYESANTISDASGWYIPSFAEMKVLTNNYEAVAASVTKAGGSLIQFTQLAEGRPVTENYYWTSDLRGSQNNWTSLCSSPESETGLYQTRNSSSYKGYFRLSIAF